MLTPTGVDIKQKVFFDTASDKIQSESRSICSIKSRRC